MSKATNLFNGESAIILELKDMFNSDLIIPALNIDQIDNDVFRGLPIDESVLCLVIYQGFAVINTAKGNTSKIQVKYKIVIIAPRESYHLAGTKAMSVIRKINNLKIDGACKGIYMLDDIREFNTPEFLIDVVAVPILVAYDVVV